MMFLIEKMIMGVQTVLHDNVLRAYGMLQSAHGLVFFLKW
jgi:hypothetical protein